MAEEKRISAGLSHPQTFLEIKMIEREKNKNFSFHRTIASCVLSFFVNEKFSFGPRNEFAYFYLKKKHRKISFKGFYSKLCVFIKYVIFTVSIAPFFLLCV